MPKQALYLKWRPQAFEDMIGQEHITRTLLNSIHSGRIRHAYLFSGPRGTGKTSTARLLARELGCRNMDLIEIDAASHTGVDDVRDLRDKIAFLPTEGKYKVYIIDEVHRFSGSAFDALLKTLEEPPPHAIFVLATTEIDKVPDTIKSRCLQFEFRRVSLKEVADRLQLIAESEGINIDRAALELIARHGTGSVRDSISLLDQIVADPQEHITLALAQRILGTASSESVMRLADALFRQDAVGGLEIIHHAIDSGSDARQFGQQLVEHLRNVLLVQTASAEFVEASEEMRQTYSEQAAMVNKSLLLRAIRIFNEAVNDQRGGWHPQLALELALLDTLAIAAETPAPQPAPRTSAPVADVGAVGSSGQFILPPNIEMLIEQTIQSRLAALNVSGEKAPAPKKQAAGAPKPPTLEQTAPEDAPFDPTAAPLVPLSMVRSKWDEVRRALEMRQNKILLALLDHAEVHNVQGNIVTLTVKNDIFLSRLNDKEHKSLLNFILSRIHDVQLHVRVLKGSDDTSAPVARAEWDVDNPIIAAGLELGAEIHPNDES